ncbi:TPA: hypothetical protein N0F65_010053 [Lagenidium giganteum]|uniref:Saccharopine dehydrogenase n=1 Tax=Lagenidium giganteum TaxID=4803 RepID=A0AAV2ZH23_9STRA|nr:TPA: hypothetical protein N0F65_010053 [Lagenidium giganteum]
MVDDVVCFGAGRVAGPLLAYVLRHEHDAKITVVSSVPGEAEALCRKQCERLGPAAVADRLMPRVLDVVADDAIVEIEQLCASAACVVALVPEQAQTRIARVCVAMKKPLVTASYVSDEMKQLHDAAVTAGIPILCEMGLDPGMDHMVAMKLIDQVRGEGSKVVEFSSVCGGLPAPAAANNPIKYKFSWSPQGALRAAQRPAQFLKNGELKTIAGPDLLKHREAVTHFSSYELEQIPNGYSLVYTDLYGIPEVQSIFRGTLRFQGFCEIIHNCIQVGLLDMNSVIPANTKWSDIMDKLLANGAVLHSATKNFCEWLGLLQSDKLTTKTQSALEQFCDVLLEKLSFAPGETDLVLMHVGVVGERSDGTCYSRNAFFEAMGDPNADTAMAKTVGITAAIGVHLVLHGYIQSVGVLRPTLQEVYSPCLKLLAQEGIIFSLDS